MPQHFQRRFESVPPQVTRTRLSPTPWIDLRVPANLISIQFWGQSQAGNMMQIVSQRLFGSYRCHRA